MSLKTTLSSYAFSHAGLRAKSLKLIALSLLAVASFALLSPVKASAQSCDINRSVKFAGMQYPSNQIAVSIARTIIEKGYGCRSESVAGEVMAMIAALYRGDIDIDMEVWVNSAPELWTKGLAEKKLIKLGKPTYENASEGWWIPRYTQKRYPGLVSVTDLAKYKDKFADPEDKAKGRIVSCVPGWVCEAVNKNLLQAFGLEEDYNLVLPGSDAALQALVLSETKRKRDILTYYWTPTTLIAKADLVQLEMPAYNAEYHKCNIKSECETPKASAFPPAAIHKGVHKNFAYASPKLSKMLAAMSIDAEQLSVVLNWMDERKAEPAEAAEYFLKTYPATWGKWVPKNVKARLMKQL